MECDDHGKWEWLSMELSELHLGDVGNRKFLLNDVHDQIAEVQ